jgi:hypothetical protein
LSLSLSQDRSVSDAGARLYGSLPQPADVLVSLSDKCECLCPAAASYSTHTSQSVSRSVSQSVSQSVGQSVSQSVGRSVSQSVSQSVGQSVSQSVNQSVR